LTQFVVDIYDHFETDTHNLGYLTKLKLSGVVEYYISTFEQLIDEYYISTHACRIPFSENILLAI